MGRGEGHSARGGEASEPWGSRALSLRGRGPLPREQVRGLQRSRILAAAVAAIEEHGYTRVTVEQITAAAGVSRRTFYDLFTDREACTIALLGDVCTTIEQEIAAQAPAGAAWCERVRGGLGAILAFFDREPALARVCVVQALRAGPEVQERREQALARLASAIDEGRREGSRGEERSRLVAEGLVGAVFAIVHARLLRGRGERGPLSALEGELMSMIALPYLGPVVARRELNRPPRALAPAASMALALPLTRGDPLRDIPMRVTFRTAQVLDAIAQLPRASNREVADRAGIADPGQISKLLARLARLGLVENGGGHAKGEPNAWSLTATGREVVRSIGVHAVRESRGAWPREPIM
jgi:AcrR family transcriptional regulator/DNA-binding MarR family transcriptional regulator